MIRLMVDYNKLNDSDKKEYKESLKLMCILGGCAIVMFYGLPLAFQYAKKGKIELAYTLMVDVYTVFCFCTGFVHARKCGFGVYAPIIIAILYVPAVIIFYDNFILTAWALLYLVLGMLGECFGRIMRRISINRKYK